MAEDIPVSDAATRDRFRSLFSWSFSPFVPLLPAAPLTLCQGIATGQATTRLSRRWSSPPVGLGATREARVLPETFGYPRQRSCRALGPVGYLSR